MDQKNGERFKGKEIILGYGPYIKTSGLLNSIIRFDTAWIGMNYFSFALNGFAYGGGEIWLTQNVPIKL